LDPSLIHPWQQSSKSIKARTTTKSEQRRERRKKFDQCQKRSETNDALLTLKKKPRKCRNGKCIFDSKPEMTNKQAKNFD